MRAIQSRRKPIPPARRPPRNCRSNKLPQFNTEAGKAPLVLIKRQCGFGLVTQVEFIGDESLTILLVVLKLREPV